MRQKIEHIHVLGNATARDETRPWPDSGGWRPFTDTIRHSAQQGRTGEGAGRIWRGKTRGRLEERLQDSVLYISTNEHPLALLCAASHWGNVDDYTANFNQVQKTAKNRGKMKAMQTDVSRDKLYLREIKIPYKTGSSGHFISWCVLKI